MSKLRETWNAYLQAPFYPPMDAAITEADATIERLTRERDEQDGIITMQHDDINRLARERDEALENLTVSRKATIAYQNLIRKERNEARNKALDEAAAIVATATNSGWAEYAILALKEKTNDTASK